MTKPEFKVMQMTPEKAKNILISKNRNNRNLKANNLKKLVTAIENGEWKITNNGLAFDEQGNLTVHISDLGTHITPPHTYPT